ncbi:MAG: hypothetical protein Q9181_002050 [Wetmoreana brouardii]
MGGRTQQDRSDRLDPSPRCLGRVTRSPSCGAPSTSSKDLAMKPSSFRQDGQLRPSRYRTPSPPRSAFEPLSPTTHPESDHEAPVLHWPIMDQSRNISIPVGHAQDHKDYMRRRQSYPPQDPMSTFASIALSTNSGWSAHNKRRPPAAPPSQRPKAAENYAERPAKRARSEKLPSPECFRKQSNAASRPATSYDSVADSRTMEAELLLNFSHAARLSAPYKLGPHDPQVVAEVCSSTQSSQAQQYSPRGWEQGGTSDLYRAQARSLPARKAGAMLHDSSRGDSTALGSSSKPLTEEPRLTSPFEELAHDFRNQLVEASRSAEMQIDRPGVNHVSSSATLNQVQQSANDTQLLEDSSLTHAWPGQLAKGLAVVPSRVPLEDDVGLPELGEAFKFQQKSENTEGSSLVAGERKAFATDYRPSMLATTIEQSASALTVQLTQALEELATKTQQPDSGASNCDTSDTATVKALYASEPAICAACKFTRNSMSTETDPGATSWISCDGCKCWFHFACAGFKNEREVRAVDKYRCRKCKAIYGPTTYVRKSARAHTAIDYAGLNQGLVKTSDERPEHHYIKPIKEGTITLQSENFARMRPELVTAEHFEKGNGMKEPIIIPAEFNPRPRPAGSLETSGSPLDNHLEHASEGDVTLLEDWFARDPESRTVPDQGQDALDMVIPHNLTVRKVAELYGPEEKVEVIDVKSQNGEGKKWNMRRWADYYENTSNKVVRNVISLEVSQSTLGRLIRRPQIVRDLDLQDSVWPAELLAKGEFPRVQFYCLMSVADCFTDFHIDFGGSSVFYHILKGKKTFFFIPPKEKHLKKYEEWCMSPAQNWTFLADQTKECYRVDLAEGDTMLIPAGWIHAVWTPEDSLVIGGNFLTRLNYSMQLRIAQIEKATGVARKFRYPHFQKIQWYTAIRYLEEDPLPNNVRAAMEAGRPFHRQCPAYHEFDAWGENSKSGPENYHARYYSQPELEGLPDLVRYLLRTALIDSGEITEGITVETRNAVKKSVPRGCGEPVEIVKTFAIWCAWKRGNELIPHWVYPNALSESGSQEAATKTSAAASKKLEGEHAVQAPRRQSSRHQAQQPVDFTRATEPNLQAQTRNPGPLSEDLGLLHSSDSKLIRNESQTPCKTSLVDGENHQQSMTPAATEIKKRKSAAGSGTGSHRKTACESCRRRRRACKHNADPQPTVTPGITNGPQQSRLVFTSTEQAPTEVSTAETDQRKADFCDTSVRRQSDPKSYTQSASRPLPTTEDAMKNGAVQDNVHNPTPEIEHDIAPRVAQRKGATSGAQSLARQQSLITHQFKGRSKACNDCRKSKRRCLHDENGKEDPLKVQDANKSRSAASFKRRKPNSEVHETPLRKSSYETTLPQDAFSPVDPAAPSTLSFQSEAQKLAPPAGMVAESSPVGAGAVKVTPNGWAASPVAAQQPRYTPELDDTRDPVHMKPPTDAIRTEPKNLTPPSAPEQEANKSQDTIQEADEVTQAVSSTPLDDLKHNIPTDLPENDPTFSQPAASSLVSPPESAHDETEQPPVSGELDPKAPYSSGPTSRQSSRHPTTQSQQRFTPESGLTRRDSSNSIHFGAEASPTADEVKTPTTSFPLVLDSTQKRAKARLGSEIGADEESLALIRKLQAEEYGLRRRGKGGG